MKKLTVFLYFFFLLNVIFGQTTFDTYLTNGFKYHDNRKLDSCQYFLNKLDSLVLLSPKDSSKFHQKEVLQASLFVRKKKMDDAFKKLLKANQYFKKEKDSANIGFSLYKLGVANYYVNRRLVAGEYFEKALKYKKFISKRLLTRIHQNFGTINLEVGLLSKPKDTVLINKSIKSYREAIAIYKQENWLMEQALATSLLAESYNQLGDFDRALSIINQAIELSKKAKNNSQLGFALIKKTSILGQKNQYKEALKNIKIAGPIFKELEDSPTLLYALKEEKEILKGLKKYREATVIGDSIFLLSIKNYDNRFADKVSEMEVKYKTAEKEKEIAIQKEEILANELAIKNRNFYAILLGSALLILTILSLGYYSRSQYKRKQLEKEISLKEALSQIKTQNRLQEQRLEISRDLHDNIGSQLTFIISSIDNLKYISKDLNDNLKSKLSNISSFTSDTIFQLRDTIWAMNKNEISFEDFSSRVLSYIEKAKTATENITFSNRNSVSKNLKFTSIEGMNLFRVVQEAINNSIKYSEADTISLNATEKNNKLILSVKDNGKGFDISTAEIGNGLSNMEKRISAIGGTIFINSEIEKGTTIKIELNVKNTTNAV